MNATFDPYYQWFGIPASAQPADYYRLLGLSPGESDVAMISAAADQRTSLVQAQRGTAEEHYCDSLLLEVRHARDCLLDPAAKASYDAALARQAALAAPLATLVSPDEPLGVPVEDVQPIAPPVAIGRSIGSKPKADLDEAEDAAPDGSPWLSRMLIATSLLAIAISVWLIVSGGDGPDELSQDSPTVLPEETLPPVSLEEPVVVMQEGDGSVLLRAGLAKRSGPVELEESPAEDLLVRWGPAGTARWRFRVLRGGVFRVVIEYAAEDAWRDAEYELTIGSRSTAPQAKRCTVRGSGGEGVFHSDEYFLAVPSSGEHELTMMATGLANNGLLVLRSIRLELPNSSGP